MDAPSDAMSAEAPRRWFYGAAVLLLILGVTAAFFQKGRESSVAITGAMRFASGRPETNESRNEVQRIIQIAALWHSLSLAAVLLAILSWCIAIGRRENHRWVWVPVAVLLALYVLLELMMV